jgi:integrase
MQSKRNGKARHPGIALRHSRSCAEWTGGECSCKPAYQAAVWSARDGKLIRKTFPTLSEAKAWRSESQVGIRRGTMRAPSRRTLRQAAEAWLQGAKDGTIRNREGRPYKPGVVRGYEAALRLRVLDDLGGARMSEIGRADLQDLADRLASKGVSASTIHNTIMPLRAIFRRALSRGELTINPTTGLELPSASGRRDRAASPQEAAELLAALPQDLRDLYATACYGGLRRGELRGLHEEDVDLAQGVIHVRRGYDDYEGEIEPKSRKGEREVPVPAILRDLLAERRQRTGRSGSDLVFGRTAREPFTPSHVRRQVAEAWAVANDERAADGRKLLEPIGLHELRHTFVSIMFEAGVPLERIGDYVGHSSTYMTDRYRHLLDGHRAEAAAMLDAYLERANSAARLAQVAQGTV